MITLSLPYPPSANRYWRNFRGRMVISPEAKGYKTAVQLIAKRAGVRLLTGEVALILRVYRPRKAGDLSNRIKVLEDALQGVAFHDDSQVVAIEAERFDDKANPRVEVDICEVRVVSP